MVLKEGKMHTHERIMDIYVLKNKTQIKLKLLTRNKSRGQINLGLLDQLSIPS